MGSRTPPQRKVKKTSKICNACGMQKNIEREFYKINQPDENFPDGRVNICRACYKEKWEHPTLGFQNYLDFLRLINVPFFEGMYSEEVASQEDPKAKYLARIRLQSTANLRFQDSDVFIEQRGRKQINENKLENLTKEQMLESELFWGRGYSEDEYVFLINMFADYNQEYDLSGKVMKDLVAQICLTQLRIRKLSEEGKDTTKELKNYQDLLNSSHMKPSQEKAAAEDEAVTLGTLINKIENEMPIAEPLEEYRDPDRIARYVRGFFTSPMARSLGKEIPYPEEYEEMINKLTIDYNEEVAKSIEDEDSGDY